MRVSVKVNRKKFRQFGTLRYAKRRPRKCSPTQRFLHLAARNVPRRPLESISARQ
jgi:hypothetical protein